MNFNDVLVLSISATMAFVEYFELIRIPVQFYKVMGQDILAPVGNHRLRALLFKILLYFGITNYIIESLLQGVFLSFTLRKSEFLLAYSLAPCIVFGFVAFWKMTTLHSNKLLLRGVLDELEDIYPKTLQLQKDYQIESFYKSLRPVMKIYAALCLGNPLYFCIFPIAKAIVDLLLFGVPFDYPLPLCMWYPFNPHQNWPLYFFLYSMEMCAAVLSAIYYLTADLFLVSSLAQLCMHFDYIAAKLEQLKPSSHEKNHEFLRNTIIHHTKCLELNKSLDSIFGFSLLLNFFGASGTICFVGFQMTSTTVEELIKNCVLFVTSLTQVFIICLYGNKLIYKSQAVGDAAFSHPWYMCDVAYRRMVVLIIARSQKFAAIRVPIMPPISLETFTKVLSMSYQFFTVIQTTSD